jgi:hypothetical protein
VERHWYRIIKENSDRLPKLQVDEMRISQQKQAFLIEIRNKKSGIRYDWKFESSNRENCARKRHWTTTHSDCTAVQMKRRRKENANESEEYEPLLPLPVIFCLPTISKHFQPSQGFFARFAQCCNKLRTRRIVFDNIRFTNQIVESLIVVMKNRKIVVNELRMSHCCFRFLSPGNFHRLVALISAERYSFEWIRRASAQHFDRHFLETLDGQRIGFLDLNYITDIKSNSIALPSADFVDFIQRSSISEMFIGASDLEYKGIIQLSKVRKRKKFFKLI